MSDLIISKKKDPAAFWNHWETLARERKAGPRSSRRFVEWAMSIAEERGLEDDRSFILTRDGKPAAAALLPIGRIEDAPAVTLGGGYAAAPIILDASLRKDVFSLIDEQAAEAGAVRALFAVDPFANEPYNFLQAFGYLDATILTYAVDLTRPGPLINQCRHGHAYDIRRMVNDPAFTVVRVDAEHPDRKHHDAYETLHERCSGRKTRSTRTFDLQYEQLLAGEATLFGLLRDGKPVAYGYFNHVGDKALYGSAADDPDAAGMPLYHRIVHAAMEHFREKGFSAIDMDEPSSPSAQLASWPDAKQRNIARFKRGFPGDYRPFHRGIRYYDPQAALADMTAFTDTYVKSLEKL